MLTCSTRLIFYIQQNDEKNSESDEVTFYIVHTNSLQKKNILVDATEKPMGSTVALLAMMGSLLYKTRAGLTGNPSYSNSVNENMRLYLTLKVAMAASICFKEK